MTQGFEHYRAFQLVIAFNKLTQHLTPIIFGRLRLDYIDGLTGENQLTLGGQNGLRGYDNHYQVRDRSFLLNIEQRYYSDWHPLRLIRLGFAAFVDVGRA